MEQSANLQLPYIMPSQAQKHVTHNEAIRMLDALVQLGVLDRDLSTPPGSPADGDRYLVAGGATDAWAGKDGMVAAWQDGAWAFLAPKRGWLLWVADEDRLLGFDGAAWADAAVHSVNPAPLVGVNATADSTNRLVVKSPASLFDEEAGDHRIKINKAAAGDTASLVFQSGYSGRAEFGLAGDDDWHVKVSADGTAWTEALKVDRTTGRVSLPAALPLGDLDQVVTQRHVRESLAANRIYYVRPDGSDGNDGLADNSGGAFLTIQKAIDTAVGLDLSIYSVTIRLGAGTYTGANILKSYIGVGPIAILGDAAMPSNVLISTISADCFSANGVRGAWVIEGVKMQTTTSGDCIEAAFGSRVDFLSCDFGATATVHMRAETNAMIQAIGNYTISGNAAIHWYGVSGGTFLVAGRTITLSGSLTFGTFASAAVQSKMQVNGNVFASGSATGTRYSVAQNSVIHTNGGGAAYLPGNAAGSAATGGQYT